MTVLAESLEARLAEARALVASGRYGQGIASLRGLLAESPGLAQAQLLLGQALEAQSDRAGAEDAFGRALALDPSLSDAAVRLARLLLAEGERMRRWRSWSHWPWGRTPISIC